MTQITLGVVSQHLKQVVKQRINKKDIVIIEEKEFRLTKAQALKNLKQNLNQTISVYGIILQGTYAIRDWLNVIRSLSADTSLFIFGSSNLENANHETLWLKNLKVKNKIISPSSSSSLSTIMLTQKKTRPQRTTTDKTISSQQPITTTTTTTTKRNLLTSTTRGGVSKPPVSVLTGRTRKTSRLTTEKPQKKPLTIVEQQQKKPKRLSEKKPAVQKKPVERTTKKPIENKPKLVKKETLKETIPLDTELVEEESNTIAEEVKELNISMDPTIATEETNAIVKELDMSMEKLNIVSHLSTCSSAATDEHDAEVAATTSKKLSIDIPVLTQSGRSSFSPSTSQPRPETPEVDQLRLKFESLAQSSTIKEQFKKPTTSPISRIKDMRPRGPVGSRVRSMVELFMDENLNKWEF